MLSPANLTALAMDAALLAIATLAQLLVLITRNIDLSVASVIGLAAYGSALTMTHDPALGIAAGIAAGCAIGLACGLVNGAIVAFGQVPAIVVTLGTMSVFRGLDSLWTGGRQISADQVPQAWLDLTGCQRAGRAAGGGHRRRRSSASPASCSAVPRPAARLFALGSNPGGRGADRHPVAPTGDARLRRRRACSPASAARSGPRATPRSTPASPTATSSR